MSDPFRIVNPDRLGEPKGWNNGMLASAEGRVLFVAGQTAWTPARSIESADFVEQFARALDHVLAVVHEAGGTAAHIGRMTVFVTDLDAYLDSLAPLGEAYRARMGRHYPAMALLEVSRLVEPGALVEIEATAILPPEEEQRR